MKKQETLSYTISANKEYRESRIETELSIPIKPLSVNAAFQGRRFKSKAHKRYEREVAYLLRASRERGFGTPDHLEYWIKYKFDEDYNEKVDNRIDGLVEVHYRFYLKNWKATDGDNLVKCIQDLIVKHGYISDDRKIMRFTVEKIPSKENRIEIKIKRFEE